MADIQYTCKVEGTTNLEPICQEAWEVARLLGRGFQSGKVPSVLVENDGRSIRINATDTPSDVDRKTLVLGRVDSDRIVWNSPEQKPGDRMEDGTVYAGTSPDTGKAMYATPADSPLTMTFNRAREYASKLDAHGHQDWRVPTKSELNVLFQNRAAIGGFDTTDSFPDGWYWSSSPFYNLVAWAQRFSDGSQYYSFKDFDSSLRCVRG